MSTIAKIAIAVVLLASIAGATNTDTRSTGPVTRVYGPEHHRIQRDRDTAERQKRELGYHRVYEIDGTKFGQLGSMSYMLSHRHQRISRGYHSFVKLPDGNWGATIGAMRFIIAPDGTDITAAYIEKLRRKRNEIAI